MCFYVFYFNLELALTSIKQKYLPKEVNLCLASCNRDTDLLYWYKHDQHVIIGPVWYMCLKIENCCLKIFVEIRVGKKVCGNT